VRGGGTCPRVSYAYGPSQGAEGAIAHLRCPKIHFKKKLLHFLPRTLFGKLTASTHGSGVPPSQQECNGVAGQGVQGSGPSPSCPVGSMRNVKIRKDFFFVQGWVGG